jgi:hypothetical protein
MFSDCPANPGVRIVRELVADVGGDVGVEPDAATNPFVRVRGQQLEGLTIELALHRHDDTDVGVRGTCELGENLSRDLLVVGHPRTELRVFSNHCPPHFVGGVLVGGASLLAGVVATA